MNRRDFMLLSGGAISVWTAGCSENTTRKENQGHSGKETNTQNPKTESAVETSEFAIAASYPIETTSSPEHQRQTIFTKEDFTNIGPVEEGEAQPPFIRVTPTDEAAQRFVDIMNENGFTDEGVMNCRWRQNPDNPGWCLLTVFENEVRFAAAMGSELASSIKSGEYLDDPTFIIQTSDASEAERIHALLQNGTD